MSLRPHERVLPEHGSRHVDLYPPPLDIVGVGVGKIGVSVGVGGVVGSGVAVGLPLPPPPPLLDVGVAAGEGVCGATVSSAVAEGESGASVGGASAEASRFPKASPTTKSVRKMMSSERKQRNPPAGMWCVVGRRWLWERAGARQLRAAGGTERASGDATPTTGRAGCWRHIHEPALPDHRFPFAREYA
jgi:hypothetical protein